MSRLELGVSKKSVLEAKLGTRSHTDFRIFMRACLTLALVLSGLVLPLQAAYAQDIPAGSYQDSCQNAWMEGTLLHADCARMDGVFIDASLYIDKCTRDSDVWNLDGHLSCLPPGGRDGSYSWTCTHITVSNGLLAALCKTRSGEWHPSRPLNLQPCTGDIFNEDGTLSCWQYPVGFWYTVRYGCSSYPKGSSPDIYRWIDICAVSEQELPTPPQVRNLGLSCRVSAISSSSEYCITGPNPPFRNFRDKP